MIARHGSSRISLIATFILAAVFPLTGLIINLNFFRFALFLFGAAMATQDVAMNTHAVTLEQKSERRLMSAFHGFFSVGALMGGAIGGLFAQQKIPIEKQSWFISLLILAVGLSMKNYWLPAAADIHEVDEGYESKKSKKPIFFILLGLIGMAEQIGEGASGDWGGVLARNTFHASPFVSTLPFICFSATMIIGRFAGDKIAARIGNARILFWGGMIAGTGMATGLFAGSITGVIFAWTAVGLGISVTIPILFSAVGSLATQKYPGVIAPSEAVATVSGIAYFGFLIGPPMLGFAADQFTLRWAMMIPAALYFIFALGSRAAK